MSLQQWGGVFVDVGRREAVDRRGESFRRTGRHAKQYELDNGEIVSSASLMRDHRNVHGLTVDVFRARLSRGARDPEKIFMSSEAWKRYKWDLRRAAA